MATGVTNKPESSPHVKPTKAAVKHAFRVANLLEGEEMGYDDEVNIFFWMLFRAAQLDYMKIKNCILYKVAATSPGCLAAQLVKA